MNIPTIGKITPRPGQWAAHNITLQFIREQFKAYMSSGKQPDAAFVDATVGFGKSLNISMLARHTTDAGMRCLILARQGELVEQDADKCWEMDCKTSLYSASLGRKSTRFLTVAGTEGTVANSLDGDFAEWLPAVILIDECHMVDWRDVMSDEPVGQYAKIINHFNALADKMQLSNPSKPIPHPVVIGYTGSPFRGVESIRGPYWCGTIKDTSVYEKFDERIPEQPGCLYQSTTQQQVELGNLVPTVFGFGDLHYDMDGIGKPNEHGTGDFGSKEMAEMSKRATSDEKLTHAIMREVMEITKNRLGVLITCASKRHCEQAAEVLPEGSYGIVTDSTGFKERKRILDAAKSLEIKYVLQIGCLTTGVDVSAWSTSVLLRRIGSLTLLVQLLGRGMRLLKPEQEAAGLEKHDHLVLDYSGTFDEMAQLYNDPILEQAQLDKAKREHSTIACPRCGTENADTARRCIGVDLAEPDGRCGFFWASKECPKCGTENDQSAQVCRNPSCRHELIDPNEKLRGKHYTDDDWKPVNSMELVPTGNGGILVIYNLDCMDHEDKPEVAKLFFHPWSSQQSKKIWERNFVWRHINGWPMRKRFASLPSAKAVVGMKAMLGVPTHITHRTNDKGYSVVHGLRFRDGREMLGGKESAQECNIESNQ